MLKNVFINFKLQILNLVNYINNYHHINYFIDIRNSNHANPNIDIIPSPDREFFVLSPFELSGFKSQLESLIANSFILNVFIIILIVSLLILIFQRYILSYNFNYISTLIEKYISTKLGKWFKNKFEKSINFNNKFLLVMFMFNSILLIIILLMNLVIISELLVNIDDYVEVYNYLHNKK
jgi:hypothetical protein